MMNQDSKFFVQHRYRETVTGKLYVILQNESRVQSSFSSTVTRIERVQQLTSIGFQSSLSSTVTGKQFNTENGSRVKVLFQAPLPVTWKKKEKQQEDVFV
jgi:hypothetical protein